MQTFFKSDLQETLSPIPVNVTGYMINRTALFLIICLCAVCILPLQVSGLPMVGFSLKPSPASGPYQDTEFLEKANNTINDLSNKTLPTGNAVASLRTTQGEMSKMSISPALYQNATDINAFIYYTWKAGDEYDDATSLGGNEYYAPSTIDSSQVEEATEYYLAAKTMWERIKSRYPGVTLYTMPESSTMTNGNYDPYTHGSTSKGAYSGLW